MARDPEKERAAREVMAVLGDRVTSDCVGEAFTLWPCTVAELVAEATRIARKEKASASLEKRRVRQALTRTGEVTETPDQTLGDAIKRDAPKRGRKSKVRKGTARLARTDGATPILHVDTFTTARGPVDVHGAPIAELSDWVDAAVRVITGAKLALLSHREVAEDRLAGFPDPRGAGSEAVSVVYTAMGAVVRRADGVLEFRGGAEAVPATMRERIRLLGFEAPPWLSAALLDALVRIASFESGGRGGQVSAARLAELLRTPSKLRRHLAERVGRSKKARSVAMSVPRKRPPKRTKQA